MGQWGQHVNDHHRCEMLSYVFLFPAVYPASTAAVCSVLPSGLCQGRKMKSLKTANSLESSELLYHTVHVSIILKNIVHVVQYMSQKCSFLRTGSPLRTVYAKIQFYNFTLIRDKKKTSHYINIKAITSL